MKKGTYYARNRAKVLAAMRRYRRKHGYKKVSEMSPREIKLLRARQRRSYLKNRAKLVADATERTRRARKKNPDRFREYARRGRIKHAAANRRRMLAWKKKNWARQLEINRNCPSYFARLLGAAVGQKLPLQLIQIKKLQVNVVRALNQKYS